MTKHNLICFNWQKVYNNLICLWKQPFFNVNILRGINSYNKNGVRIKRQVYRKKIYIKCQKHHF